MDLTKLAELLGLKAEATEDEISEAIKANAEQLAAVEAALGEVEGDSVEAKVKTLVAALADRPQPEAEKDPEPDPEPEADKAEATAGMGKDAAEMLVDAAVAAGRIPPKSKDKWVTACAGLSVDDAKALLADLPSQVPGDEALKDKANNGDGSDAPAIRAEILRQTGLTADAIEKYGPDKVKA